jgi:hypothetical protein
MSLCLCSLVTPGYISEILPQSSANFFQASFSQFWSQTKGGSFTSGGSKTFFKGSFLSGVNFSAEEIFLSNSVTPADNGGATPDSGTRLESRTRTTGAEERGETRGSYKLLDPIPEEDKAITNPERAGNENSGRDERPKTIVDTGPANSVLSDWNEALSLGLFKH